MCLAGVPQASAGAEGRIVTETLHSRALRGNLIGDTPDRRITIYLPPSYERDSAKRYPVLYLLHGMTSDPREWLDGSYQGLNLNVAMDDLAGAGLADYIVVMPLADNGFGGSFYVNSAAFGRWEDFVVTELVRFVDARFRTRPVALSRGLAGQSMGGFGALYLAGRHPETFGHVYAMSPCCLGFLGELAPESDSWKSAAKAARVPWIRAMAAAFAPGSSSGPSVSTSTPFAPDSMGRVREVGPVSSAWREYLPLERLMRDRRPYRRLRSIGLEVGRQDEIPSVRLGTVAFARELQRAGIRHTLDEYTGGHTDHTRKRFERALLPFFARVFSLQDENGVKKLEPDKERYAVASRCGSDGRSSESVRVSACAAISVRSLTSRRRRRRRKSVPRLCSSSGK
jgi:S-formylglutathione hydrolase